MATATPALVDTFMLLPLAEIQQIADRYDGYAAKMVGHDLGLEAFKIATAARLAIKLKERQQ